MFYDIMPTFLLSNAHCAPYWRKHGCLRYFFGVFSVIPDWPIRNTLGSPASRNPGFKTPTLTFLMC
jgi:hypothetical protein